MKRPSSPSRVSRHSGRPVAPAMILGAVCFSLALAAMPVSAQTAAEPLGVMVTSEANGAVRLFWQPLASGQWPAGGFRVERLAGPETRVLAPSLFPGEDPGLLSTLEESHRRLVLELRDRLVAGRGLEEPNAPFVLLYLAVLDFSIARSLGLALVDPEPPRGLALTYRVTALGRQGETLAMGQSKPLRSGEEAPLPPTPTGLRGEAHPDGIGLWWDRMTEAEAGAPPAVLYRVLLTDSSGRRLATLGDGPALPRGGLDDGAPDPPWFVDREPPAEELLYYSVVSLDPFGRESLPAPPIPMRFPDWAALSPPENVDAESLGGSVRVTWTTAPNTHRRGFVVVRALGAWAVGTPVTSEPVVGTTFVDTTARPGTAYWYRVHSVNRRGDEGPPSLGVGVLVQGTEPPPPPLGLRADVRPGKVVLGWQPGGDLVAGYRVERATASGDGRWALLSRTASPAPAFDDLVPMGTEGELRYRVRAVGFDGLVSPPSEVLAVTLPDLWPPQTPVITGIDGSDGAVVLGFRPVGGPGDAVAFVVLRSLQERQAGSVVHEVPLPAEVRRFEDKEVTAGVTYYYRVMAIDAAGNRSDASAPVAVVVGSPPIPVPAAPRALFEERPYPRVLFTFEAPRSHSLRYLLERQEHNGLWRTIQGPVVAEEGRLLDTKPPRGSVARYRLTPLSSDGASGPPSPVVEVEIP